jgi:hypothetical protein
MSVWEKNTKVELPVSNECVGQEVAGVHFSDFGLDVEGYKFDREEANVR